MTDVLQMKADISSTNDFYENFKKFVFTHWLNTGALDDRILAIEFELKSEYEIAKIFLNKHPEVLDEAREWVQKDSFIVFVHPNDITINHPYEGETVTNGFLISALGKRIRELAKLDRRRMPNDLKKSFLNKARTRLLKVNAGLAEYNKQAQYYERTRDYKVRDLKEWLKFALESDGYIVKGRPHDHHDAGQALREIRNIYRKTCKFSDESIDDVVDQLMSEVPIIEVQTA